MQVRYCPGYREGAEFSAVGLWPHCYSIPPTLSLGVWFCQEKPNAFSWKLAILPHSGKVSASTSADSILLLSCWSPILFCLERDCEPLVLKETEAKTRSSNSASREAGSSSGDNPNPVGSSWAEQSKAEWSSRKSSSDRQGDPTAWREVSSGSASTDRKSVV